MIIYTQEEQGKQVGTRTRTHTKFLCAYVPPSIGNAVRLVCPTHENGSFLQNGLTAAAGNCICFGLYRDRCDLLELAELST